MAKFLRRLKGKSKSGERVEEPVVCVDAISLCLLEFPKAFKIPKDATIHVRFICDDQSTVQTQGSAFATNLAWKPAFRILLADFVVEVILKRAERFRHDLTLGHFSVEAAQLGSTDQEGSCDQTYRSPKSDKSPSVELTISFSGLASSTSAPLKAGPSTMLSSSQQTTTIRDDNVESVVDHAGNNADTLQSPAGLEIASVLIDTVTQSVGPVESALAYAESLGDTLKSLAEAAGYVKGIIILVKDFADIHPISKVAVGILVKVYDLVQKQGGRDENIKDLASSMRDMLASLAEVKDLAKIQVLRSVISVAMTRVCECAKFINLYAQHGFWGRLVRQSLSSRTADAIQRFQQGFCELKDKFNTAVSIQTLKDVAESRQVVEGLKGDLRNIGDVLVARADEERLEKLPRSKGAWYDRGLRCLPGTRQDILSMIYDWIDSKEEGNNIFWLRGAAGSGKSTIASTIAALLDNKDNGLGQLGLGSLGATFFCKRDDDSLNQPKLVFPTIAFRLASTYPLLREGILSALKANPDVGYLYIANQFQELIVGPLSRISNDLDVPPVVTIIDAADECGNESTREPLLQCLKEVRGLPAWFKVLVISRPEQDIRSHLDGFPSGHEVDTLNEQSISDIRAFTQDRIESLKAKRRLDADWPGELKLNQLVSRAGGLFIWVTLSFEFMSRQPSPTEALEVVLKSTDKPHLDTLYRTVLVNNLVEQEHFALVRSILGCIVVSKIPLSLDSICTLLKVEKELGNWARDKLASVLPMDSRSVIRVIHPSFLDFLTNRQRSKEFFIDEEEHHLSLARGCLQVMKNKLRTNICRLTDSTVLNDEIPNLQSCLDEHVPDDLSYSCQYWAEHLKHASNQDPEFILRLRGFCEEHVLHWLEVMSLKGETRSAIMAIQNVQRWLLPNDPLMELFQDLIRFFGSFGSIISRSAPHMYLSASIFTPPDSPISLLSRRGFRMPPKLENLPDRFWDPSLLTLNGHLAMVLSVAFSPDGTKIVSGSGDGTLRVWDTTTGLTILGPLMGHTDSVTSVAFSPDGTKIVSSSGDETLRVWDATSGLNILGPLMGHTDWVTSAAFSPDGTKIVSGSGDNTLHVWDATSGLNILGPLMGHTQMVTSVAFSPDGTKIVSGSGDETLHVWDATSGLNILGPLTGHTHWVMSVAFSPDGTMIVSGSIDKTLHVWDATSGLNILGPLMGHTQVVTSVAFSPDGTKIVSGSYDKTLRVWDAASGLNILGPLMGHTHWVTSAAFSPDGTKIVSGSEDRTLRVWDATSRLNTLGPLMSHSNGVMSVAFSPDGTKIVSGSEDQTLRVWDATTGLNVLGPLIGHTHWVTSAAFSPDGTKIVSGSEDKTLRVWDATSGLNILGPLMGDPHPVTSVAFSPDGTKVVSGSIDNTLHVWDATSGLNILGPLMGHTHPVMSVAFSPDGLKIVSGSIDNTLRVWNATTGLNILGPLIHIDSVISVAFSPDGTKIVSGSNDSTLRVWDATSGLDILGPLIGHTDSVRSVAFSPDGTKIVSGSYDKILRVWDATSGLNILGPLIGHTHQVRSVAFSPDGSKIVSGSGDETLRVWDATSGLNILGPLIGHTDLVKSAAFSPDGTKIVSGSIDNTLRVWDVTSGLNILGPLMGHTESVTSVAFSPDGMKIVSGSNDKTLHVWDATSGLNILGPLIGHTDSVISVAFTLDGTKIVSGSDDKTLRVWDATSGSSSSISDSLEEDLPVFCSSISSSSDGWIIDSNHRKILWIPAHFRETDFVTDVHGSKLFWFNPQHLPMIVTGLDLSWWAQTATR